MSFSFDLLRGSRVPQPDISGKDQCLGAKVRLLDTRRLRALKKPYAKPTRSLGGRALQQRAPRQGRTCNPRIYLERGVVQLVAT
jgi:hypothetical protein